MERGEVLSDLTAKEQESDRDALRFLRLRVGAWGPLAKALRYEWDSMALRVARFAGVGTNSSPGRALGPRVPALGPPAG